MSMNKPRLLVTGASGQLGRLVIEHLRRLDPAADITAMVRTPQAADELAPFRVATRIGDYTDPASLDAALTGIDRLLLISSSVLGQRAAHHKNVIEAATRAGVSLIAYTSILRADTSELSLAAEHLATEKMLRESGLPFVILRNGWYLENDTAMLAPEVAHGAIIGSAGDGRLSSASRSNYAEAAALVLLHGAAIRYRLRTCRRRGVYTDAACGVGEPTSRKDGCLSEYERGGIPHGTARDGFAGRYGDDACGNQCSHCKGRPRGSRSRVESPYRPSNDTARRRRSRCCIT